MGFVSPYYVLLGLLLIPFMMIISKNQIRLDANRQKCGLSPLSPSLWQIWGIILTLCSLAAMRPYVGSEQREVSGRGATIIAILDISRSMLAEDIRPNRLEAAKRKLLDFVSSRKERHHQDKIGIVLFAGAAYLYAPPTEDYAVLKTYIQSIQHTMIPQQGSALNEAISVALGSFSVIKSEHSEILLLTDGEDNALTLSEALHLLKRRQSSLSIIGIGSSSGAPIPDSRVGFLKDDSGTMVISKLNRTGLSELATQSGGIYVDYTIHDADINQVMKATQNTVITETRVVNQYREYGYLLLALALLCYCAVSISSVRRIVLPLLILCIPSRVFAESLRDAASLYNDKQFEKAGEIFNEKLQESPDSFAILQGLGSSQFKKNSLEESIDTFRKLTEVAQNNSETFTSHYNLGNAFLAAEQYQEAIKAYDVALKIYPQDLKAITNREIALRKLKETSKDTAPDKNNDSKSEENSENKSSESQDNSQDQNDSSGDQQKSQNRQDEQNQVKEDQGEKMKPQEGSEEEQQEQAKKQDSELQGQMTPQSQPYPQSTVSIDEAEATRWLNSLPEAPLLLRRKTGKTDQVTGQTW